MKKLLSELETTTERGVKIRAELFSRIKGELTVHEIIEEEIFYPELKAHPRAKDIVLEGYEEHHVVDVLMKELEELDVPNHHAIRNAILMFRQFSRLPTGWRMALGRAGERVARWDDVVGARGLAFPIPTSVSTSSGSSRTGQ